MACLPAFAVLFVAIFVVVVVVVVVMVVVVVVLLSCFRSGGGWEMEKGEWAM